MLLDLAPLVRGEAAARDGEHARLVRGDDRAGLALGVSDTFRGPVLRWNGQEYESVTDSGQLGITGGFEFGVGYDLARVADLPVTVHLDYFWYAAIPWLPAVPLGPQSTLSVGVRVALGGGS